MGALLHSPTASRPIQAGLPENFHDWPAVMQRRYRQHGLAALHSETEIPMRLSSSRYAPMAVRASRCR